MTKPDPATTTPATSPAAVRTAIELNRTSRQLDEVTRRLTLGQYSLDDAQAALDSTDDFIAQVAGQITVVKARLAASAATAYVRHGAASSAPLAVEHVQDLERGDQYAGIVGDLEGSNLDQLTTLEGSLQRAHDQRAGVRDDAASEQQGLSAQQTQLTQLRNKDSAELQQWGAIPIMGDSWLTASELASWYRSTGAVPRLAPGTTIDDLAQMYIQEGEAEHVRGDIAFAQSIIESASFSVAAGNNYSGIGACDSCNGGLVFASPRDGVRAQIQLLRNYADPDSRAANLTYRPDAGLYGSDPTHAARLYDTFFLKGKVPVWNLIGGGYWATDPSYAGKVLSLYAEMVGSVSRTP